MAGSITNNATLYKKKTFIYVPPVPPAELIDSTSYTLDFVARKFLNVGLDPTDEFNAIVQIITPSQYINMPADFLRRIFSLMGNILSFILDTPEKDKRNLFLETDNISLSSMVYQGENVLVIASKTKAGCRALLNRSDLIHLQYLEWCIFEIVVRKSSIIRSVVLKQFEIISNYIDQEFTNVKLPPKTNEEMIIFIKNLSDDKIIGSAPKEDMNFISQLKINAKTQLAENWAQRWSGEMSPELFTESEVRLISPRYSSMSSMLSHDEEDPSQARGADEERGLREYLNFTVLPQVNPTWAPIRNTKPKPTSPPSFDCLDNTADGFDSDSCGQYLLWYNNRVIHSPPSIAVDENDGPTSFNLSPSSPPDFLGFTELPKNLNKQSVKRKLFD